MGLYFAARGRSAPLRQHLYEQQLALVVRLLRIIGKVRTYAPMVLDSTDPYYDLALADLRVKVHQLAETKDTAAAILPTELFVEVSQLSGVVTNFLVDHDEGRDVTWFAPKLAGHATKTALLARTFLGVDELSTESTSLFATKSSLKKVSSLAPDAIAATAKQELEKPTSNES
jgi:hypothetical protein